MQTTLPTVRMIVDVSKSVVILSSAQVDKVENLQTTSRTCRPLLLPQVLSVMFVYVSFPRSRLLLNLYPGSEFIPNSFMTGKTEKITYEKLLGFFFILIFEIYIIF